MKQEEDSIISIGNGGFERTFDDLQNSFYQYMRSNEGGLVEKTSGDYISRMRFLSAIYRIDENITEDDINRIIEQEKQTYQTRDVYNTMHAVRDFQAGLRKFLKFVRSDYLEKQDKAESEQEKEIQKNPELTVTTKQSLIKSRIGQGLFRKNLIEYWHNRCAISGCAITQILTASHIKPWRASDNNERLDTFNGLLLLPNYDKLFDNGLMTFDIHGNARYSRLIAKEEKLRLGLSQDLRLAKIDSRHIPYLQYHNDECFIP